MTVRQQRFRGTRQEPGVLFSTATSRTQAYTVRDRGCVAPATFRSASPPPASPARFDRRSTAQSLSPVEHDHQFLKPRLTDAERGDLIEYSKSL